MVVLGVVLTEQWSMQAYTVDLVAAGSSEPFSLEPVSLDTHSGHRQLYPDPKL
jgi:hypothetical protein